MEDGNSARQKHPSNLRIFVTLVVIFGLLALVYIVSGGYVEGWKWTGIVKAADFPKRTFWDWMELLIVPAALAIGAAWLTWTQRQREREAEDAQLEREREAQAAQKERELEVENQRAQDAALQAYLDQMSNLLLQQNLREAEEDSEVRTLARARTLTVLSRLDGDRKGSVLQFLSESRLISNNSPLVSLREADLSEANLEGIYLSSAADLGWVNLSKAKLAKAYMAGTFLRAANLEQADLREARLFQIDLRGANLNKADLRKAWLSKGILLGVNLSEADLRNANLNRAVLVDAGLSKADLSGANLANATLNQTSLIDANLSRTNMIGVSLRATSLRRANLTGANLRGAELMGVGLNDARLTGADLRGANLSNMDLYGSTITTEVTNEQLVTAKSLEGATMPNGQILKSDDNPDGPTLEEWLKSREEGDSGS